MATVNYPYTSYTGTPANYSYPTPTYQFPPQAPAFQPNQPQPMVQPQNNVRPSYICYPVGSVEEAIASRVEAFDPPHIMLDLSHNQIYYKKFNQQTGGSDFETFKWVPKDQQAPVKQPPNYEAIAQSFSDRLDGVDEKLTNLLDILEKAKTSSRTASKGAVKE